MASGTVTLEIDKQDKGKDDGETETVKISKEKDTTSSKKSSNFPNPHYILTIVSLVLCTSILNFFSYFCLIPALINSRKSKKCAEENNMEGAVDFARKSLILNMVAVVVTCAVLLAAFIVVQIALGAAVYPNI